MIFPGYIGQHWDLSLEEWAATRHTFFIVREFGELSPDSEPLAAAGLGADDAGHWRLGASFLMPPLCILPRSFSELYTLSLQEPSRRGAAEPVQDETPKVVLLPITKQLLHLCLQDGSGPSGAEDLAEERTEFLHSQNPPSPRRCTLLASLVGPGQARLWETSFQV